MQEPTQNDYDTIRKFLREDPYGPRTILTPLQMVMLWMWVQ
jgi:hypothetical protein